MTTQLFSNLEINDVIQLESALQNLLMQIDSIAGRRSLLQASGVDAYFIANLDFNLSISEFVTILVAKFKVYKISIQQIYAHPMLRLIDYIFKQNQKYNLTDEDIKIFRKILLIAESKIETLTPNNQEKNLALTTSEKNSNENITDLFIPPEDECEYQIEEQAWYASGFPETEEILEELYQPLKQEIDIVLITATDVELKAVARHLKPYTRRKKILLVYSGPETYYLGKFGAFNTVVTKCRMGAIDGGSVILAAEQAQRLWNPKAIIMVGIAFGKDPTKQKMGDVLVASQIISYEQQRVGEEIIYRGSIPPSNTTLLNRFENVQNWNFKRPDGSYSNIIIGPILSGEKLVYNPDFKATLFQKFPQAVGGEMEGAGLCAVLGRVGTAWILVKSICDWGDGKKHKKHQPLAAAAAASLMHHVLSQKTVMNGIKKLIN